MSVSVSLSCLSSVSSILTYVVLKGLGQCRKEVKNYLVLRDFYLHPVRTESETLRDIDGNKTGVRSPLPRTLPPVR